MDQRLTQRPEQFHQARGVLGLRRFDQRLHRRFRRGETLLILGNSREGKGRREGCNHYE